MDNLKKLAIIAVKVVDYEMDERIYRTTLNLMYRATLYSIVSTWELQIIETALCKKIGLDYIEISRKYYNLESYISVDDIIFDFNEYEWDWTGGISYTVDIIKFRKEDYREISKPFDDEYIFDNDDTDFGNESYTETSEVYDDDSDLDDE